MTSDPDVARAVRAWLDEGADRLPERVLDAVLDAVPTTHQRRPSWPVWRFAMLPRFAQVGIAVAVLAVAVVAGFSMGSLGGVAGPAPTVSPSPSPSAAPTASPSSAGSPRPSGGSLNGLAQDTVLGGGTYAVDAPFAVPFSVALPTDTKAGRVVAGEASVNTPLGYLGVFTPDAVYADPCHPDASPVPVDTVAALATALQGMQGFVVSGTGEEQVDGHPAQRFVLTNGIDTATAGCTRDLMLPMFTGPGNEDGAATNGGTRQVVWALDVGGTPVLIVGDGWGDSSRSDLESIVRSISFR